MIQAKQHADYKLLFLGMKDSVCHFERGRREVYKNLIRSVIITEGAFD